MGITPTGCRNCRDRRPRSEGITTFLDTLVPWCMFAVMLVLVAYGPSLIAMLLDQVGIQGYRLW